MNTLLFNTTNNTGSEQQQQEQMDMQERTTSPDSEDYEDEVVQPMPTSPPSLDHQCRADGQPRHVLRRLHWVLPGRKQEEHLALGVLAGRGYLEEGRAAGRIWFWAGVQGEVEKTRRDVRRCTTCRGFGHAGTGGEQGENAGTRVRGSGHAAHRFARVEGVAKEGGGREREDACLLQASLRPSTGCSFKLREEAVGRWQCTSRYAQKLSDPNIIRLIPNPARLYSCFSSSTATEANAPFNNAGTQNPNEEKREVGGEGNIGTERSPYSKKKAVSEGGRTDGNETNRALKIEDRNMRDFMSRIASSTGPRTGVADIDPRDLSSAGRASSSDTDGCHKRDAERGGMIGDPPAQIQDNREVDIISDNASGGGQKESSRNCPHHARERETQRRISSEDFRVPGGDSVPKMRKRTCCVMHLVSPVTKGGGKGVNKTRQSRYEGEEDEGGGLQGDGGKNGKGEGGEGEVTGRERESDAEVVEMPGEQRREKKGTDQENVKEEDMNANADANAKWNGRQGQIRASGGEGENGRERQKQWTAGREDCTPIALAVSAAAEGSQTSLSGGPVKPAEAVDLTPLIGYGGVRSGEREPGKKNALERPRRKEEGGVEREWVGQRDWERMVVLPPCRTVRGLSSAAYVTASVESPGPRAQVEAKFAFESSSVTVAESHKSHEFTQTATNARKAKARSEAVHLCVRWLATDRASSADEGFPACSAPQPSTTQAHSSNACYVCDSLGLVFLALG
ncbi:hypothetical protein DFH08DRAFT_1033919 [Mycena albidolilacea]|uniref:Uncharacterized protein n=1 Tax=Mycena albidolilacea TaxID=1033008 RepID=A0AAD7EFW7_9AGAR|nr:hypothetical protein DFH08DRAFT_1033919 [Mycena albidolilacea]